MRHRAKEGQPRPEGFVLCVSKTVGEHGHDGVISSVMERHRWRYQTGSSAAANVSACKHKVITGSRHRSWVSLLPAPIPHPPRHPTPGTKAGGTGEQNVTVYDANSTPKSRGCCWKYSHQEMQRAGGVLVELARFLNRSRWEPVARRNTGILFDRQRHLVAPGSPPPTLPQFAADSSLVFPGTDSQSPAKIGGSFATESSAAQISGQMFQRKRWWW